LQGRISPFFNTITQTYAVSERRKNVHVRKLSCLPKWKQHKQQSDGKQP